MTHVLTLSLDTESQSYFEALRQLHFPPERNQIPAHLTLFHTLPNDASVERILEVEAGREETFAMAVTGIWSLGKGVAYKLESATLLALHARLSNTFAEHLTAQDKQRFSPHIVVQNKVTAATARELLVDLQQTFAPMQVQALGMDLWCYMGGPWELARTFLFAAP